MAVAELEKLGLKNIGNVFHNLSYDELIKHELANGEVHETKKGATAVDTGIFTGRSPKDKYFVDRDPSNKFIAWGDVNQKISSDVFEELLIALALQLKALQKHQN